MNTFAVEFDSVERVFPHCRAVDGVSASFERGKIHAILGENGAGKSTLMKLLFGLLAPTGGTIRIDGEARNWKSPADAIRAGLGMVQQHFTLVDSLSVIDNIMLGYEGTSWTGVLDRERAIRDLEANLPSKALRLDWHQAVGRLSVGEKQKVEILKLIARKSQILVLDEPTAVLSPLEISGLFEILKSLRDQGRTVFVITHKLGEVFDHCDTWFVLRAGKAMGQGLVSAAKLEDVIRAMVGSHVPPLESRTRPKLRESRLKFSKLSITGAAHPVRSLDLELKGGEILGIAGVDGSGQSEIVEALLGLRAFTGKIEILESDLRNDPSVNESAAQLTKLRAAGLGLVGEDRHRESLWLDETVELNSAIGFEKQNGFVKSGWLQRTPWREAVTTWLKSFDVRFNSLDISVARLSGGNQQKLIFARELLGRDVRLLVVHQPTRGVDCAAIRLIHERIIAERDRGAAVLVISSELDELMALSDRILVLCAGRATGEFVRAQTGPAFDRERIGAAMTDSSKSVSSSVSGERSGEGNATR
jgi:general nucleoside transport system ATP-binding protein